MGRILTVMVVSFAGGAAAQTPWPTQQQPQQQQAPWPAQQQSKPQGQAAWPAQQPQQSQGSPPGHSSIRRRRLAPDNSDGCSGDVAGSRHDVAYGPARRSAGAALRSRSE